MIDQLIWQTEDVRLFLQAGGPVLWAILALAAIIGCIVTERYWFLFGVFPTQVRNYQETWQALQQRNGKLARPLRSALISQARIDLEHWLPLLKTLVALCPLLGLLGTVTGMIEVFNIMAVTGGGDAKSMAGGVQQATIPTMAGMVAALSGVFANTYVTRIAQRESVFLRDNLTTDH